MASTTFATVVIRLYSRNLNGQPCARREDVFRLETLEPEFRRAPRRKRSNLKKITWRFLRMTLKPFEELCPGMQAPWPGLITRNDWL